VPEDDAYRGGSRRFLPPETVRVLSAPNGWATTGWIALEYAAIAAAALVSEAFWNPVLYLAAVLFIGGRAHGLGVIGLHDGAHYRLYRSRRWNDRVASYLVCLPLLRSLQGYRRSHFAHHRYTGTERDPDLPYIPTLPMSRRELVVTLVKLLSGWAAARYLVETLRSTPPWTWIAVGIGLAALVGAVALGFTPARLLVLYWLVPNLTWGFTITTVRSLGEHYRVPSGHPAENADPVFRTREILPTWFDRVFVASHGITYHLAHHLYPSVPFFRLGRLRRLLMEEPAYAQQVHLTRGYQNLLRELVQPAPPPLGWARSATG